jgi:hypothetical protein
MARFFHFVKHISGYSSACRKTKPLELKALRALQRLASKRPRIINIHIPTDKYKFHAYIFASFIGLDRCNANIAAPIGAATDPLDFFLTIRQP